MEKNLDPKNKMEEPKKEAIEAKNSSGSWFWIIAVVVLILVAVLAYAYRSPENEQPSGSALPEPAQLESNQTAAEVKDPSEETKVFNLSAKPFEFSVKEIRVKRGDKVRIDLTVAQGTHDWVVDEFNAKTKQLNVGQSESVTFTADKTGTFEYYCSVGNHRQMGMVGKLIVA